MNHVLTDIRFGIRMLIKYPTLSLVAVLTLGLGIGLSTTVFCVVNGGLFKGLPFPDAGRIVSLVGTNPSQQQPRQPISVQDLAVWQARQTCFEKIGAFGVARTRGEPGAMTPMVRSAVASLDGDLAISDISTMRTVIDRQTWFYTVFGTFFMAFGFCALFLAAAGLYGVMSFAVTQRTRELGVRSALGAQERQLVLLIMRKSVVQLVVGLFLGLGLALLASGALQPVLYHVDPRAATVFAAVIATLALASLIASFLPAWRVTKIDPALALAAE